MGDESLRVVKLVGAEALFMLGADDDPETVENFDVEVTLGDGSRWTATFLTLSGIRRLMDSWHHSGEALGGSYFQCADLVIVERGGVGAAAELLRRLVDENLIQEVFVRVDIED